MGFLSGLLGTKKPPTFKASPTAYDAVGKDAAYGDFKQTWDLLTQTIGGADPFSGKLPGLFQPAHDALATGSVSLGKLLGEALNSAGGANLAGPYLRGNIAGLVSSVPTASTLAEYLQKSAKRGAGTILGQLEAQRADLETGAKIDMPWKAASALAEILSRDARLRSQQDQAKHAERVAKAKKGSFLGNVLKGAIGGAAGGIGVG